jgi:hypothetical protein
MLKQVSDEAIISFWQLEIFFQILKEEMILGLTYFVPNLPQAC